MANNNYSASKLIITINSYLAILVVIVTTALIFKFCTNHTSSLQGFRSYSLQIATCESEWSKQSENLLREKKENLSYVFSVLFGSVIIFFSLFLSNKYLTSYLNQKNQNYLSCAISGASLFLIVNLIFRVEGAVLLFPQLITFPCALLLVVLSFAINKTIITYSNADTSRVDYAIKITYIATALILSLLIVSYWVFDDYHADPEGYSINFSPIAYPIIQQYLGKELLMDFKSLYGLHPYFLQIFLYIFPPVILTLSLILASLFLASLLSLAFFIFNIVENKLLALAGFMALIYMQNFSIHERFAQTGAAFQYEAIRLFPPALLLSFLYFFYKNPSRQKYYSGLIFFSLATIWNLDTGIPAFLTLVVALGYEKLKNDFDWKFLVSHLAKSFAILVVIWCSLIFFLKIKYGEWPHFTWLFYGQLATLDFGYAMMPIPPRGIWQIVAIIYAIGLVFSINNFLTKKHSLQNSAILSLTILGIGLFTYYIGRSHVSNIMHCGYPAFILLIIFSDKFCKNLAGEKFILQKKLTRIDSFLFSLPLFFISYLSVVLLFEIPTNKKMKDEFILTKFSRTVQPYWISELNFIEQHIDPSQSWARDDILLIPLNEQDYYFALKLRAKSPLNIANIRHAFYQEELDLIYSSIKSKSKKWVILIDPPKNNEETFQPPLSDAETQKIKSLLNQNYKINSKMSYGKNGGVIIFEKNK